jgi:hypothetical protein
MNIARRGFPRHYQHHGRARNRFAFARRELDINGKWKVRRRRYMKTIIRLIVCLLLVIGWGLAALSLHVVRTADTIPITLVTKERFGITDTYVDTREWTLNDAAQHPLLVQKLVNVGKADLLKHVVENTGRGSTTATTLSSDDLARVLIDALRTAQGDSRDRATQPSSASSAVRQASRGFGWF